MSLKFTTSRNDKKLAEDKNGNKNDFRKKTRYIFRLFHWYVIRKMNNGELQTVIDSDAILQTTA